MEKEGKHSFHSIESVEFVKCCPLEDKCCDISICELRIHDIDNGVRHGFEDFIMVTQSYS
jgi:hypothetical protein